MFAEVASRSMEAYHRKEPQATEMGMEHLYYIYLHNMFRRDQSQSVNCCHFVPSFWRELFVVKSTEKITKACSKGNSTPMARNSFFFNSMST